jgi:predicted dehydrogenase
LQAQAIRLAVLGCAGDVEAYHQAAARLRRGSLAPGVLESIDDALAQSDTFDAAIVRTSLDDRVDAVCRLAEVGKHVLVDSPFAASATESEKAFAVAARSKVTLMVGGTLRFLPGNQTILSRLAEKKLGAPGLLRVHRWSSGGGTEDSVPELTAGDIDLALHIFGGLPTRIYALQREPAYLQIHFGFDGGGMAVLDFARGLPEGQGYESLHVIGTTGAAYADDHHNTHLVYRGGEPRARISGHGSYHVARELQEFVDAILEKRPPAVTGEDGCKALQVIEAIAGSLDSGKPLHWKDDTYEVST